MNDAASKFKAMHIPGKPLILYNIWDAGSAVAVASAGAKALATGSYGVAEANGFKDGETLPLDFAIDNLGRILGVTDLPVSIDMEAGYGATQEDVARSVRKAADVGAAGINLEDKDPVSRELFAPEIASARIKAAASSGLFVNARADEFIVTPPEAHDMSVADAVIDRAKLYADAGASGLFVPFVFDEKLIASICERSPIPVNILINPKAPGHKRLAELGVARISHGHGPWADAMDWLKQQAGEVYDLAI